MKHPILFGALALALALAVSPLAAETQIWPWKDKKPLDPALVTLTSIESVTASLSSLSPPTLTVKVEASAPTQGYTELQLWPRAGDRTDLIFAFDAKGRPPQDRTDPVVTPVTISLDYAEVPAAKLGTIEIYGETNCKAISIKDNKPVECTSVSLPQ